MGEWLLSTDSEFFWLELLVFAQKRNPESESVGLWFVGNNEGSRQSLFDSVRVSEEEFNDADDSTKFVGICCRRSFSASGNVGFENVSGEGLHVCRASAMIVTVGLDDPVNILIRSETKYGGKCEYASRAKYNKNNIFMLF